MSYSGGDTASAGHGWVTLALVLVTLAVRGQESARPAPASILGIEVFKDGAVEEEAGRIAAVLEGRPGVVRIEFGMPETEPLARGILEGAAGTARTHWEKGGIRYTQSLLLGEVKLAERGYRVLLVRLTGENSSKDYTEATAAFAVRLGGRWLELEWRQGLVHAVGLEGEPLVAAVEIGAEGIEESAGARLRFRGNMPPGTSGAMTVKIPLERLAGEVAVNGLRDLDFDEEYRRIKRGRATGGQQSAAESGIRLVD